MEIAVGYLLKALLLPPAGNCVLGLVGYAARRQLPRAARALMSFALLTGILLMAPFTGALLARPLEDTPALQLTDGRQGAEAIVVLAGGRVAGAQEYGGQDTLNPHALERLRYGVYLHHALQLPLALVGGSVRGEPVSEGMLMLNAVNEVFKVPVQWVESGSRNTAQNAEYSRYLLPSRRILLVTHAIHMRRARMMFEAWGFEVVPAPLHFTTGAGPSQLALVDFIPSVEGLAVSRAALHEYLGLLWYRWFYLSR
jgi:uncharacterized SAM-binding protein YcdF (DUF218 family)